MTVRIPTTVRAAMKNLLGFLDVSNEEQDLLFKQMEAKARVDARFKARKKAAVSLPRGTLLDRGNAPAITDAIRYYAAPLVIPGGIVGLRLFFARMSDELRLWHAPHGAMLRGDGQCFILQALDAPVADLRLSFDGMTFKRMTAPAGNNRVVELRQLSYRGSRLG